MACEAFTKLQAKLISCAELGLVVSAIPKVRNTKVNLGKYFDAAVVIYITMVKER